MAVGLEPRRRRRRRWLGVGGITALAIAVVAFAASRPSGRSGSSAAPREHGTAAGGAKQKGAEPMAMPAGPAESDVAGRAVVKIDPERQQLIGVTTAPVELRKLERLVRTVGLVKVDEGLLSDVYPKVSGWIEKLYANQTGKLVRQGQPLLTIYSPDLVSTQEEYLVALRSRSRLANSPFAEVRRSGDSLVAAARDRLRLWDIPEKDIKRLEQSGQVRKTLTLYAPTTGYIMEKQAVEGLQVSPGMPLYKLAGLSRVWVEAAIYENEASLIRVGQRAKMTLQARPGRTYTGQVTYIYPTVEAATRTLTARLEFPNPGLGLKPDMYADVVLAVPGAEELTVPETAVIDTGRGKFVFVKVEEGTFVPREMTVGPRGAGYYPVLSGVSAGETVVTSANFLIDSEAQFRAAAEAMKGGGHAGHGG